MKNFCAFAGSRFIGGLLVVVPIYLSVLLLLKAMQSVVGFVRPFAMLLPAWFPAERALSLLLVLIVCFLIGVAVRTPAGRMIREQIEKSLFERIPGYALFRSLTQRMAGKDEEKVWKPALAEIEEALVPAFIIEELEDGRFTVFVPSVPTPFAGARLCPQPRTRPSPGCPLHASAPICLPVGIWFKGTCRRNENREHSEIGTDCFFSVRAGHGTRLLAQWSVSACAGVVAIDPGNVEFLLPSQRGSRVEMAALSGTGGIYEFEPTPASNQDIAAKRPSTVGPTLRRTDN